MIASKIADYLNTKHFLKEDVAAAATQAEQGGTVGQGVLAVAAAAAEDLPPIGSRRQHSTTMTINLPITSCKTSSTTRCNPKGEEEEATVQVTELAFEECADHLLQFLRSAKGETYTRTQLLAQTLRIEVVVDDAQGAAQAAEQESAAAPCGGIVDDISGAVRVHLTLIDDATPANLKARIQQFDADTLATRRRHTKNHHARSEHHPFAGAVRNASLFEQAVNEKVPIIGGSTTSSQKQREELKRAVVLLNRQNSFQCEVKAAAAAGSAEGDRLAATAGQGALVDVNDAIWWGDKPARMKDIVMMLGQRRQSQPIDRPECEYCECRITRHTNAQADPLFELAQVYATKKEEIEASLRALTLHNRSSSSSSPDAEPPKLDATTQLAIPPTRKTTAQQQMRPRYVPRVVAYWYLLRSFLNLHLREAAVERDLLLNHLPHRFYTTVFGSSNSRTRSPSVTEFAAVTAPGLCAGLQEALDARLKAGEAETTEAQQLAMILKEAMDLYLVARAKLHGKTEAAAVAVAEKMQMRETRPDSLARRR